MGCDGKIGLSCFRIGLLAQASLAALLLWGCTDSNLYHQDRSPAQADRVTFRGQVCTEDPTVSQFPLKVVFLVDRSDGSSPGTDLVTGTLFTTFDPEGARLRALRDLVGQYQRDETVSFSVIGFGGAPLILAPDEGSFTRNAGELEAAIATVGIPQGCEGQNACRDLRGALGTARSVIEGDLTALSPGARTMMRYVVILLLAGPPSPQAEGALFCQRAVGAPACCDPDHMDCVRDLRARICCPAGELPCTPDDPSEAPYCCPIESGCPEPPICSPYSASIDCSMGVFAEEVRQMREAFEEAGVASFNFHALHLLAEQVPPPEFPDPNESVAEMMQQMAFAGSGVYAAYADGSAIEAADTSIHRLGLLRPHVELEVKDFMVFNLNALPGIDGIRTDTDADGLDDVQEAEHGTDPGNPDTDGDGITDFVEVLIEFSPITPDFPAGCEGLEIGADRDNDLLTDCDEALLGTDRSLLDSDGDAMPDRLEVTLGTDYVLSDWLVDADNDGVHNGDEVRQHSDPRSSDAADHLGGAYRYTIDDQGLRARIDTAQPSQITGVEIARATEDSAAGLGWLCYEPDPDNDGGWLCWIDAEECTSAGGRLSCNTCDRNATAAMGNPIRIDRSGEYVLPSPTDGNDSYLCREEVTGDEEMVLQLTVNVDVAALPPRETREQILVHRDERHCIEFTVRNVRLAGTGETVYVDQTGWNNIALFFAQAPQGRLTVPGIFRTAMIPVRFIPPDRREPFDAELIVWDDEFVRAGTFE